MMKDMLCAKGEKRNVRCYYSVLSTDWRGNIKQQEKDKYGSNTHQDEITAWQG